MSEADSRIAARRSTRRLAGLLLASVALPGAALATPASTNPVIDKNGVDLIDGSFNVSQSDITIGPSGLGGMSYVRSFGPAGWTSNQSITLDEEVEGSTTYEYVTIASVAEKFQRSGSPGSYIYTAVEANGTTLVQGGSTFTYIGRDGSVITFGQTANLRPRVNSVTLPSGDQQVYTYKSLTVNSIVYERLQSITNNTSYQLKLTYALDATTDMAAWSRLTAVTAINNVIDYCDPASDGTGSCSFTGSWPSATYSTNTSGSTTRLYANGPLSAADTTRYTMDANGRLIAIRFPSHNSGADTSDNVTIGYDGSGRVSTVTRGDTWTYTYADSGPTRTTTVTDPLSHTRVVVSNTATKRMTSDTDGLGHATSYSYSADANARLTRIALPEGNAVALTYDARGNITQVQRIAKPGSSLASINSYASYPSSCSGSSVTVANCNKPTWTKDALGNQTDYSYDPHGFVTLVLSPAPATGAVRPSSHATLTALSAQVRNSGGALTRQGSSAYRVVAQWRCMTASGCGFNSSDAVTVSTTYDENSNLLPGTLTNALGSGGTPVTATMVFDAIGNMVSSDGPLSGTADTTYYSWDAARNPTYTSLPDPDGSGPLLRPTTYRQYTSGSIYLDGHPSIVQQGTATAASATSVDGFVMLSQNASFYDAQDRLVRSYQDTGPSANPTRNAVTQYSYDAAGRPDCVAIRMNPAAFGSLPSSACTLGTAGSAGPDRISQHFYDAADRATSYKEGLVSGTTYARTTTSTYNNNNTPAYVTDGAGHQSAYGYDGFDRLDHVDYPNAASPYAANGNDYDQQFYDAAGNVTSQRTRDAVYTYFGYDKLNRLTSRNNPGSEADYTYAYDNLGRMKSITTTDHLGDVSWTYDEQDHVLSETTPVGTTTSEYADGVTRSKLTYPGSGVYFSYEHDQLGRLTAIHEPGTVDYLVRYAYDDLGRMYDRMTGQGTSTYGEMVRTWSSTDTRALASLYERLDRTAGSTNEVTFGYTSDAVASILSRVSSKDQFAWGGAVNANRSYAPNGLNQYASITSGATLTPGYDARGNMTGDGTGETYGYDSQNRMVAASGTRSGALTYDALGRLTSLASGGVTTRFLWSGDTLVAEYNGSTVLRRYVHGEEVDRPAVWYEGATVEQSTRRYLFADERGSIVATTGWDGTVIPGGITAYDEYGIPSRNPLSRFGYTGQLWLPELGLDYYKARMYSPTLGRFMQTDPIGYADGPNEYDYAHDDPVDGSDPTGTEDTLNGTYQQPIVVNGQSSSNANVIGAIYGAVKSIFCGIFGCHHHHHHHHHLAPVLAATSTPPPPQNGDFSLAMGHGSASSAMSRYLDSGEVSLYSRLGYPSDILSGTKLYLGIPEPFTSYADGFSLPGKIYLDNLSSALSSPAQAGLIGHELFHQWQYSTGTTVRDFIGNAIRYGTGPETRNPLEMPAYAIGHLITQCRSAGSC